MTDLSGTDEHLVHLLAIEQVSGRRQGHRGRAARTSGLGARQPWIGGGACLGAPCTAQGDGAGH